MNRRSIFTSATITVLGLALLPTSTIAQQKSVKEQLVGTWTFVSATTKRPDGSLQWGSNPKGLAIYTDNGRFSESVMRSDRTKFAANNRLQGTADDNKAAVQGTISTYGTYSVDEAKKTYTLRIEGSSYPNWEGTEITRPVTITGDEMTVTNPSPSVGGPPSQLVFRRPK
jgi:Lipocalin-like domain